MGFANIRDVNVNPPSLDDIQESFVLTGKQTPLYIAVVDTTIYFSFYAETMKYYYLLFSPPDLLSLDDYVFNTEA